MLDSFLPFSVRSCFFLIQAAYQPHNLPPVSLGYDAAESGAALIALLNPYHRLLCHIQQQTVDLRFIHQRAQTSHQDFIIAGDIHQRFRVALGRQRIIISGAGAAKVHRTAIHHPADAYLSVYHVLTVLIGTAHR